MKNKALHPAAAVLVVTLAVAALGFWGWRLLNRGDIGPNGEDYSIPAVQPTSYRAPDASGGPGGAAGPATPGAQKPPR